MNAILTRVTIAIEIATTGMLCFVVRCACTMEAVIAKPATRGIFDGVIKWENTPN